LASFYFPWWYLFPQLALSAIIPAMKRYLASLFAVLGYSLLLWGCDFQNLPTAVAVTPTVQVTPTSPLVQVASPTPVPATGTPQPLAATDTPNVPTPEPTTPPSLTPTKEPSPTLTIQPSATSVSEEITPAPTRIRSTRTPTSESSAAETQTPLVAQPTKSTESPPTGAWSQVVKVAPGKKRIALTFDAGASGETCPRVLATLQQHGVHITMFFTGKFAEQYPDCIKQALANGNELANHTYSHLDSRTLTDQQLEDELGRTEQIIQNLTGSTTKPYWRPPFGAYNSHVLNVAASQGYRSIYWTLDSLDSVGQPKTPDFIYNRVTNPPAGINLDGAIILQHFGSDASADALPRELDTLQAKGLQVVTISELLSP